MSRTMKILIVALLGVACSGQMPDAAPSQQKPTLPPAPPRIAPETRPADVPLNERAAFGEIRLAKVGSVCQVVAAYNTVRAVHGQAVLWVVHNRCETEQRLDLINFREKFTGTPVFPFDPGDPLGCTAPATGSRRCFIVLRVLDKDPRSEPDSTFNKVYTYDFSRKGGDPELVIEWP